MSPQPRDRHAEERRSLTFSVHSVEQPIQRPVPSPTYSSAGSMGATSVDQDYTLDYTGEPDGYESEETDESVFERPASLQSFDMIEEEINMYQENTDRKRAVSDGVVQKVFKERSKVQRELEMDGNPYRRTESDTHVKGYMSSQTESQMDKGARGKFSSRVHYDEEQYRQGNQSVGQEETMFRGPRDNRENVLNRGMYRISDTEKETIGSQRDRQFSGEMFEMVDREIKYLDERLRQMRKTSERVKQELIDKEKYESEYLPQTEKLSGNVNRNENKDQAKALHRGVTGTNYLPEETVTMMKTPRSKMYEGQSIRRIDRSVDETENQRDCQLNTGHVAHRKLNEMGYEGDHLPRANRRYISKQYSILPDERQREVLNETYLLPEDDKDGYRCSERRLTSDRQNRVLSVSTRHIPDSAKEKESEGYSRTRVYNKDRKEEYEDYDSEAGSVTDSQTMHNKLERLKRQKTRILAMKAREEEIRQKEMELNRREKQLKYQAEIQSKVSVDPYEEELMLQEKEMEEKMLKLRQREKQIEKAESMNKEKSHPEVSKESAAAKSPDNQEPGPQHTQIKTETVINEIVTGEKRTATSPKKQTAEQKDNNTTDRGTDAFTQEKASFFPKFSTFSGDEPKQRRESSFEEWQYEVLCCLKDGVHSNQAIGQAIRKSLIGQAKQVLISSGTTASIDEIMKRLERVFGNVASGASMMQEFYTATQKQAENIVAWGLRLEEIIKNAVDKGHVKKEATNTMLKNRFWKGLRNEKLKNRTQIHYVNIDDYQELLSRVREEESEMKLNPGVQHLPVNTNVKFSRENSESSEASKLDLLYERLTAMEENIKELNKKCEWQPRPRPFGQFRRNNRDNWDNRKEAKKTAKEETTPKDLNC